MKTKHYLKHLLLGLVAIAGLSLIVMLLWNWLIPCIFGGTAINYWQTLGLLVLSRILLGGRGWHGRRHWNHGEQRNLIREKWMQMSPEERKEFINQRREHLKGHWHHGNRYFDHWNEFFGDSESDLPSDKAHE